MSMNPIAQSSDFARLPIELQEAHMAVLRTCDRERLSCRCEMAGRDFVIVVGRGLSSAKYWMDNFAPHG